MRSLGEIITANRLAEEKEKRNDAEDRREKEAYNPELCVRCAETIPNCVCLLRGGPSGIQGEHEDVSGFDNVDRTDEVGQ